MNNLIPDTTNNTMSSNQLQHSNVPINNDIARIEMRLQQLADYVKQLQLSIDYLIENSRYATNYLDMKLNHNTNKLESICNIIVENFVYTP